MYEQDDLAAPGGLFERLRQADLVVGFNILRFDYHVLQPFADYDLASLPTLDMLDTVKRRLSYRVSLDNLAKASLDAPKSADGLQALEWWKQGRIADIAAYCRKDVELTRGVYLYGREHGHVLFTNKAGQKVRIPVDW
jgi:DEAD/DEAH box helicase domain-containing protein